MAALVGIVIDSMYGVCTIYGIVSGRDLSIHTRHEKLAQRR